MTVVVAAMAALIASGAPGTPGTREAPGESLDLNSELRVKVVGGREIVLEALARPGETWRDLAGRLARSPERAPAIAAASGGGPLRPGRFVTIPLRDLSDDTRAFVLHRVFPRDRLDGDDWIHIVRGGALATYDEGLWQVAEWFCGDGAAYEAIQAANGLGGPEPEAGRAIRIPGSLLHPSLRSRQRSDDGALVFGRDALGAFAGYRLAEGETLWSAVVARFTGRTDAEDIEALAGAIARRSAIADPTDIPVGWMVKIPLDLLEVEFLPRDHPHRRRVEEERSAADAEWAKRPALAGSLRDAVVVLDPGHGGRDIGTEKHGLWEHDYVYDIAVRVKRRLEESGARVHMTLVDEETGTLPSEGDDLRRNQQGTIRTTPPFLPKEAGDATIGVHLRWYLANAILRREVRAGVDPSRVVFLSIHADARHASLRGAMVYVPGARYRTGTEGSSAPEYLRFAEVRERPKVSYGKRERLVSEAASRRLARDVVGALRQTGLPVQEPKPIRDRIIRGRRTWLPAVLRGNAVPAKVLVEVLNLANRSDAALIARAAERQRIADAMRDGIAAYFDGMAKVADRRSP